MQGTHVFKEVPLSDYIIDSPREKKYDKDWFVYDDNYGTTEEKRFVRYFATQVEELEKVYDTVYLIRNERKYHIYSFDDGRRFEADYILILGNNTTLIEQQHIFIEPKGRNY